MFFNIILKVIEKCCRENVLAEILAPPPWSLTLALGGHQNVFLKMKRTLILFDCYKVRRMCVSHTRQ